MSPSTQHAFEHEEVMAYLDGELEPQRAAALASHLHHCADCQAVANQLRQISERMLGFQVGSPSADLDVESVRTLAGKDPQVKAGPGSVVREPRKWTHLLANPYVWVPVGALVLLLVGALSIPTLHTSREAADRALLVARQILPFAAARPGPPPPPPSQRAIVGGSMEQSRGEDAIAENIVSSDGQLDTNQLPASAPAPMIARTASLSIIAKDFDPVEAAVKGITDRHHGYLGELSTSSPQNAARTLTAALRIPAPQLEAALAELKQLGRVEQESQSGEEVTKQYTDLAARLKNSQETEQRLLNVLRNNTGKVRDILEAEAQIERVRGQIEEMQAEQRALKTRVDFATVQLTITEDFRASLEVAPPSTSSRLHNAVVDGYHAVVESLIGLAVWLLSTAPILLLWAALLFFPVRWAWKRWLRPRFAKPSAA